MVDVFKKIGDSNWASVIIAAVCILVLAINDEVLKVSLQVESFVLFRYICHMLHMTSKIYMAHLYNEDFQKQIVKYFSLMEASQPERNS